VAPEVRRLPGVTLIDLEVVRQAVEAGPVAADLDRVRSLVAAEVAGFLARQRALAVAPTVVALRAQAAAIVRGELTRLAGRLPDLDPRAGREVEVALRRVVDKLLHAPTVRVQELAESPDGQAYAQALHELFGLDRTAPAAVSRPDPGVAR
jgi:glutamyl-tRNA reductase